MSTPTPSTATASLSGDDLYPKMPYFAGADRYPETEDSEVIFMARSPVSGQLFTRSYRARELIRSDVSTRLPDLRAQVFFVEARKLLSYVKEVEQHPYDDEHEEEEEEEEKEQAPPRYSDYRHAVGGADSDWEWAVDEHLSEMETPCQETPMLAECPKFWPASRILVAADIVQLFEDATARSTTHIHFRLSFALWNPPSEPEPTWPGL